MSRYIDADELVRYMEERQERLKDDESLWELSVVETFLGRASSADVVKVVRCKDCKHHEELLYNNDGKVLCWVHDLDVVVDGNGYCNYGERKEQEHDV